MRVRGVVEPFADGRGFTLGYRVRLARARLDMKAVDGAAEAATGALDDLSGGLASRRVSSELDAVARRLTKYPEVADVGSFLTSYRAMSTDQHAVN